MAYGPFNAGVGSKNKTIGSGAPTTSTVGKVGQDYFDRTTGTTYTCVAVSGSTYTWEIAGTKDASKIEIGEGAEKTALDLAIRKIEQNAENAKPLNGTTDPTESTKGAIGQTYTNTATGKIWTCVAADDERGVYAWEVSGGTPKTTELLKGDGAGGVSAATPNVDYTEPWVATKPYAAGAYCVHNGYLWHNTSGAASTGVEPGTNYNVWNVTYSNENLLDNPWFTVNQRGWTSDDADNGAYTVDRWKITNGSVTVTVNVDGTLTLTNIGTEHARFSQIIEKGVINRLIGRTLVASADVVSVTGNVNMFLQEVAHPWQTPIYNIPLHAGVTVKVSDAIESFTNNVQLVLALAEGASITVRAVKLELGSVSTLANDSPPNYAEELMKCQRYYQIYDGTPKAFCFNSIDGMIFCFSLPIEMRAIPSVTLADFSPEHGVVGTSVVNVRKTGYSISYYTQGNSKSSGQINLINTDSTKYDINDWYDGLNYPIYLSADL